MRILITGGNGFLGSNLIGHFLKLGHELLVISRNSNNIQDYLNQIKFQKHDWEDYFKYEKTILDFNPNIVIHLAWEGGNSYSNINDLDQIYKNIPAGLSLLEIIAKQDRKPKYIGCGTFLEYGPIKKMATENTIENPDSFYGLSKVAFKKASQMYCHQNNIDWAWIRPCYIYGNRDVKTRLVPSVINRLLGGEDLILDDCNITIDYLHVDDFCLALERIIETNSTGVFNICSGEEQNLKQIVEFIKAEIDPEKTVVFDSKLNRSLKPRYICGSNQRLKDLTGWVAKIGINEGITKTIEHYKNKQ